MVKMVETQKGLALTPMCSSREAGVVFLTAKLPPSRNVGSQLHTGIPNSEQQKWKEESAAPLVV